MNGEFVIFRPVYRRNEQLVAAPISESRDLAENVQAVFDFYEIPYLRDEAGAILIPTELAEDLDTLWNLTTKANDPAWLADHR